MTDNLPQRKSIRLKYYDYSLVGYYFITICTKDRKRLLSTIKKCNNEIYEICLTQIGEEIHEYLNKIKDTYVNVKIDEYVIMPNHLHMLLIINSKGKTSISKIIQQFKGMVTKKLNLSIWQKSFYEHIIRNEKEYIEIKQYIINNPYNWENDKYY